MSNVKEKLSSLKLSFEPISHDNLLNEAITEIQKNLKYSLDKYNSEAILVQQSTQCSEILTHSNNYTNYLNQYYSDNFGICSWSETNIIGSAVNWLFDCNSDQTNN